MLSPSARLLHVESTPSEQDRDEELSCQHRGTVTPRVIAAATLCVRPTSLMRPIDRLIKGALAASSLLQAGRRSMPALDLRVKRSVSRAALRLLLAASLPSSLPRHRLEVQAVCLWLPTQCRQLDSQIGRQRCGQSRRKSRRSELARARTTVQEEAGGAFSTPTANDQRRLGAPTPRSCPSSLNDMQPLPGSIG